VLVGGGAKLPGLVELAKEKLKLPVQIGLPQGLEGIIDQIDDPEFAVACGLILSALNEEVKSPESHNSFGDFADNLGPTVKKIKTWIKGFAP
jgi:cell division protein FtsA